MCRWGDSPDEAPDGHIERTAVPYDLNRTIEEGAPILTGIDDQTLSQSIRTLNRQLAGVPAITEPTFEALTQMSEVITNRKDQINQLIADTKTITTIVNDNQAQLAVIVGQGRDLTQKIVAREELVTRLLDGIAELTEQASAVAGENANQFAPDHGQPQHDHAGSREEPQQPAQAPGDPARDGSSDQQHHRRRAVRERLSAWGGIFPDNWLCLAKVVDGC